MPAMRSQLDCRILTPHNWSDLVTLFGEKGACGGCWCMTPRLSTADYNQNKGAGNKQLLHGLVKKGEPLGVMGYTGEKAIAWCSISPKSRLLEQRASRLMKITPAENTWSIVCLFIQKEFRRMGVSSQLISAACKYAFDNGATIVEAYPVVNTRDKMPDVFAWTGIWKSYERAGFKVVKKVSDTRWVMRRKVKS